MGRVDGPGLRAAHAPRTHDTRAERPPHFTPPHLRRGIINMALTGQLSDMSLAELIEFFCNQRKTGRLKIDYPRGHSVFFIKDGELVDARVGTLSGAEAVYFSLTLPNAAFDFSPDVQATRRTIHHAWTQVVLEGLRRLDEGISPTEADAFGKWEPSETELAQMLDQVEHLDAPTP